MKKKSVSNELGRLAQGVQNRVDYMGTIIFIHKHEVPPNKRVTYTNFICDLRSLKNEPERVRITVGGDQLFYAHDAGSPATDLLETKILLNSTISHADRGAKFRTLDLENYFLATPMADPEYMRIHSKYFSMTSKRNTILII